MTSQPQTQMQTTKQTLAAPAPWTCSLTRKADRGADGLRKVAAAPAPWTLKVKQSFAMLFSADLAKPQALHQHLTSNYDVSDFLNTGAGAVLLVRYEDSPAGPYDELLLIPGAFRQRPSPPGDDGRPTPPPAVRPCRPRAGRRRVPRRQRCARATCSPIAACRASTCRPKSRSATAAPTGASARSSPTLSGQRPPATCRPRRTSSSATGSRATSCSMRRSRLPTR
ncbi:hypothetical protein BC831DRAFT_275804 [Entophlyctis helioformis]|nr:hypothetical protein BC831DRAFT_275804 [Entophlyctis helioformis]